MEREARAGHLTDDELFGLALPPAGEPEALPSHLLECSQCGRALQEWKGAVRQLAEDEVEPVMRRSAADWRAAENQTLEALRRQREGKRFRALPWAIGLAASVLLAVLLAPAFRPTRSNSQAVRSVPTATELSGQDAADDALLRDVARLSRGEDANSFYGLAPDPGAAPSVEETPL